MTIVAALAAGDLGAVIVSGLIAQLCVTHAMDAARLHTTLMFLAAASAFCVAERGLYGRRAVCSAAEPTRSVIFAWTCAAGMLVLATSVASTAWDGGMAGSWPDLFRPAALSWIVATYGAGLVCLVGWRRGWYVVGGSLGRYAARRVVLVGEGLRGSTLLQSLQAERTICVVGLYEPSSNGVSCVAQDAARTMPPRPLDGVLRAETVDAALLAGGVGREEVPALLRAARTTVLDVFAMPGTDGPCVDEKLERLGDVRVVALHRRPLGDAAAMLKRAEDVIMAGAILTVIAPIFAALALAVKLDSPGPVLFRQPRVGRNGRVFSMFKFRSMYHAMEDQGAVQQTARRDPRVTRVGAFLRRHSLDELPQILNVLRGDMSIVGPRPHALAMTVNGITLDEAAPDYEKRFSVKPGITGWAQVNGWRGNVDTTEKLVRRVEHDLHYIQNWSLGLDLQVLVRTVRCVIQDDAAY